MPMFKVEILEVHSVIVEVFDVKSIAEAREKAEQDMEELIDEDEVGYKSAYPIEQWPVEGPFDVKKPKGVEGG